MFASLLGAPCTFDFVGEVIKGAARAAISRLQTKSRAISLGDRPPRRIEAGQRRPHLLPVARIERLKKLLDPWDNTDGKGVLL